MKDLSIPQMKVINAVCTTVSVGSTIATPILITKANQHARIVLERYDMEDASLKEKAQYTWKCYIPAGLVMGVGIAASVIAGAYSNKVVKALTTEIAAHALSVASKTELQDVIFDKIKDKYGLDVAQEMRDDVAQEYTGRRIEDGKIRTVTTKHENTGNTVWLCDDTHGRYFKGSMEAVKEAVNESNAAINHGQMECLADIYDRLGMDSGSIDRSLYPKEGDLFELAWSSSLYNGEPCAHFGFRSLVVD